MISEVITHHREFTAQSLQDLAGGRIDLIWHEGFYPEPDCKAVLPRIVEACEAAEYTLTNDLQSLGTSLGEATESEENATRYLGTAQSTTRLIRETIFGGHKSPGDMSRLLADECWPHGAMVGRYFGRMMLPGIIRRWPAGGQANPHIDPRDIPLLENYNLSKRMAVNVYLEMPSPGNGGELEFWHKIQDEDVYEAQKRSDYGLDRDSLGDPAFSLLPAQGDLVIFDAARVHGVRKVTHGSRVTAACFLGVRTLQDPLVVFA